MFRTLRVITTALLLGVPALASGQAGTAVITGTIRDASGGTIPGAVVRIVNEQTRGARRCRQRRAGGVSTGRAAGRRAIVSRSRSSGFEPAVRQVVLATGETAAVELTLTPARLTEGVVVTARRVEEAAQEVADPADGRRPRPGRERRRLQRQPLEGADPDGAVLFDQPAQLGDQHPRPRRAVRPDQRRARAGRRPLHRRRLLRAPGVGDARLPRRRAASRCCAGPQGTLFGKNTTAGAINVTTRKPSFTRGSDFELNVGDLGFVQAKASVTGPLGSKVAGRLSFSGTQRDGTRLQHQDQAATSTIWTTPACADSC